MLTGGSLLLEEIHGEPLIFLPHLRRAEEGIAARTKSLAEAESIYPPIDFEKAVAWCERRTGKTRTRRLCVRADRSVIKEVANTLPHRAESFVITVEIPNFG